MPRAPRARLPIMTMWMGVSEKEKSRTVDRLAYGNNGALTALATCKHHLQRETPRLDLAEKALRRAAMMYAAIKRLGYEFEGMDEEIEELGGKLGLVVI